MIGINIEELKMHKQEKIDIIRDYLLSEFSGSTAEESYNSDSKDYTFYLIHKGTTYIAKVSDEFIDTTNASDIEGTLRTFLLAEHLRDLAGTCVVVTKAGLELE